MFDDEIPMWVKDRDLTHPSTYLRQKVLQKNKSKKGSGLAIATMKFLGTDDDSLASTSTSHGDINTALEPGGLPTEIRVPLLPRTEKEKAIQRQSDLQRFSRLRLSMLFLGTLIGFTIQITSLLSYIYSQNRWGEEPSKSPESMQEYILHAILKAATQVDMVVYATVWIALTYVMTKAGVERVVSKMGIVMEHDSSMSQIRREIFLLGVNSLAGLVIGAFGAWVSYFVVQIGRPYRIFANKNHWSSLGSCRT